MQMPLPVRTRLTMPMVLALLILVAGFVAIAWTVQWATSGSSERITQATQQGAAALAPSLPPATNAVNSLPAFALDLDGATGYQPQTVNGWLNPKELDKLTEGNLTFVWLDSWWVCSFITAEYAYKPVGMGDVLQNPQDTIDMARWNDLTFRQQQNIKKECAR
jgi:hypothetical protein